MSKLTAGLALAVLCAGLLAGTLAVGQKPAVASGRTVICELFVSEW